MFSKIISVAVALLLASPIDDAAAATKKKKKTPIENSQSHTRGTSSMMRSDSYRGRVTQGRLPTPRAIARGSAAANAPAAGGSTFGAGVVGSPAAGVVGSPAGHTFAPPSVNASTFTAIGNQAPGPSCAGCGGSMGAISNQPPSRTTKPPPPHGARD